jgi:isoleucyl-tRNA synthetase
LSPLIPLYVEEAWHYTPASLKGKDAVYKVGWFKPQEEWHQIDLAQDMQILEPLKECVLKILEEARQKQFVPNISRSNA